MQVAWAVVASTAVAPHQRPRRAGRRYRSARAARTGTGYATGGRPTLRSCGCTRGSAYYQDKRTRIDWTPWGAALASLSLVASEEVAAATSRFAEAMREFKTFDLGGKRTKDDELQLAAQVLAQAQMVFVNAARRSLDHSQRSCPSSPAVPPDCATGACQSGVPAHCQGWPASLML